MPQAEPTRVSLLLRLRDARDSDAWSQFADIYGSLIFHFGRRSGLQPTDAADLVQEVMGEVSKSIIRFEYDPAIGKFRSWLYKITRRTAERLHKQQQRQPSGTGDTAVHQILSHVPDPHADWEAIWNKQYERQLLHWAAARVQQHFHDSTWQAFWRTAVEGHSPQKVADDLGMGVGSVYVAKNRVMKRLAEAVLEIDHAQ